MNKEEEREKVIARLIANTLKRKRPHNLVRIAHDIRWLERDLGSLKAVSDIIRVSTHMLGQFLSVEKLCPEVRSLVEQRKIDLINVVHYMRNFDHEAQKVIAEEVVAGRLSGNDIRALAPLRRTSPCVPIEQLISHIQISRNIKSYIAYFQIPPGTGNKDAETFRKRFEEVVGKDEIIHFKVEKLIGVLELTPLGQERIREAAKKSKLSLRKFVNSIVQGQKTGGESLYG